jgi:plastocyanin
MTKLFRLSYTSVLVVLAAMLLVACSSTSSSGTSTSSGNTSPHTASVTIPRGQDLFSPFILAVQPNALVTWQNNDTASHAIMTTQDQTNFLNPQAFSLTAAAGQNVSFTCTRPGVYDYFDKAEAQWDEKDHRVKANQGVPHFPLAMEGIIWVQGSLSRLPSSATNLIPNGKDDFSTDFLALSQGGTVTWHNSDTDNHFVASVPGWSAPINPVALGPYQVKGTQDAPSSGGTIAITFHTPGLYYYYCPTHADLNPTWHRAQAHKDASEFPIPMEGFVLVASNKD